MNRTRAYLNALMTPADRQVLGKVRFDPAGCHRVILAMAGAPEQVEFSKVEAVQAIKLLEQGIREMDIDDMRPTERTHMVTKGVEQ